MQRFPCRQPALSGAWILGQQLQCCALWGPPWSAIRRCDCTVDWRGFCYEARTWELFLRRLIRLDGVWGNLICSKGLQVMAPASMTGGPHCNALASKHDACSCNVTTVHVVRFRSVTGYLRTAVRLSVFVMPRAPNRMHRDSATGCGVPRAASTGLSTPKRPWLRR